MNRPSRCTIIFGTLALTMLVGASLACSRGIRQNDSAPTADQPAARATATESSRATDPPQSQPTDQASSDPEQQQAATAPPTATEGTSEADALGAQVEDLLNQLDAANSSADDLSDGNP